MSEQPGDSIPERYHTSDEVIQQVARKAVEDSEAADNLEPRGKSLRRPRADRFGPVHTRRPHPLVKEVVDRIIATDGGYADVQEDGSVVIRNHKPKRNLSP